MIWIFWLIFVFTNLENEELVQTERTHPTKESKRERTACCDHHPASYLRKDSEMYHDPETHEWYIEANPYFVSLEASKAVIINTDYSHEVRIEPRTEFYLSHICSK